MDPAAVQWSELCNTDSSVALAYYLSKIFSVSLTSSSQSERLEAVGVCRDVVRDFAGVCGGGRSGGPWSGDRCSARSRRVIASVCGVAGVGHEHFLSGGGCLCGRVAESAFKCDAGDVLESVGNGGEYVGAGCVGVASARRESGVDAVAVDTGYGSCGTGEVGLDGGVANDAECEGVETVPGKTSDGAVVGDCDFGGVRRSRVASQDMHKGLERPSVKGKNYARNKAKRERQKMKNVVKEKTELQRSSEEKWMAQNKLAALEAERKIALIGARDFDQEKRSDRARIQRNLERNMVAIEKTHATLRATGNVPGEMGFCETIIGSGSISPDSSASQAEIRAMVKELEDSKAKLEDSKVENAELKRLLERNGIAVVDPALYDKRTWTQNEENFELLDKMYPNGYALNDLYVPDGKARVAVY